MKMSHILRPKDIEVVVESGADESELPQEKFDALLHEIEELSKDENRAFANALALVHEAYRICDIERPAPSMRGAWDQYEKCMAAAVQYLAKNQPNGKWRLTSSTSI